jgi:hypothetical protein
MQLGSGINRRIRRLGGHVSWTQRVLFYQVTEMRLGDGWRRALPKICVLIGHGLILVDKGQGFCHGPRHGYVESFLLQDEWQGHSNTSSSSAKRIPRLAFFHKQRLLLIRLTLGHDERAVAAFRSNYDPGRDSRKIIHA